MINNNRMVVLRIHGASASWAPETNTRPRPKTKTNRSYDVGSRDNKALERARRRRITGLSRYFGSLEFPPRWFITLTFDKKVQDDWQLEECIQIFKKFSRYLQRTFPAGWFIFVLEWKPTAGFHYHVYAKFGQKKVPTPEIRRKWMELTRSKSKKSFHMGSYAPVQKGYTMKVKKAKNARYLISLLGYSSFWGVINQKNIQRHPSKEIHMTGHQLQQFKNKLMDYAMAEDYETSTYKQLNNDYATLNFFPKKIVDKAISSILGLTEEQKSGGK